MEHVLPEQSTSLRVLLIEDDPDIAPLVYGALRQLKPDLSIVWVSDSARARNAIATGSYDVVIADYSLDGGGTGWTLLQQARARDASVRVGILSALPLGIDKLGAPFLRKPFVQRELVAFLRPLVVSPPLP